MMTWSSRKNRSWSLGLTALFFGAALAGCFSTPEAQAESGLYVKDELTDDVVEVHVAFTAAQVLPAEAQEWVTVFEGERTIELLSLSDSTAREKLADLDIAPGEYAKIRIAVSNVTVVFENGSEESLLVFGNVVTIGEDFTIGGDDATNLVVDFDLDDGVDIANGTYTPFVKDVQSSRVDSDGDGTPDFEDADDDGDGIEDAEDEDRDGDGKSDVAPQEHGMDGHGVFGVCTAYEASENGRTHGNATNSTAFQWLQGEAAAANMTVEEYCAEEGRPGPPGDVRTGRPMDVGRPSESSRGKSGDRDGRPDESAGGKPDDAPDGKPDDAPNGKPEDAPSGRPDNSTGDDSHSGNATAPDAGSEGDDHSGAGNGGDGARGNESADHNETGGGAGDGRP